MLIKTAGAPLVPAKAEPTSLLKLVAGEFAGRIAALWPAPHTAFVTAPAPRRHLLCMALAFGRDVAALADALLGVRLKHAIPAALGATPHGLPRALTRMGDVAWPADAYAKLLDLLAEPRAAKMLRHAEVIEAEAVRRMAELPAAMSQGVPLEIAVSSDAARVLRDAYEALRMRSGAAAADAAAQRWVRAGSAARLVEIVRDDLYPEPAAPPHSGTPRLAPLATKAAMRAAAQRYRNCLRDQIPHAASGWSAHYEWTEAPGAIVEVTRDAIFGWRLEQARMADNAPVPEPLREAIAAELALMGVHVGRSSWELDRALDALTGNAYRLRTAEESIGEAFGD
ncbi:hypothetical protein [Phenylobacterium sp.]|jgi:hypothetical protein|uniref:hypothetical protein n=1 Tax=Phenylobacterium sp. TaxID=1871053 RepID=UPI002F91E304